MTAQQFEKLLIKLGACRPAREWAKGKTLTEVWDTCDRGDWLLWLAHRMSGKKGWPNRKAVVLAACACAETALRYVPAEEKRPLFCIQTARRWAVGQATVAELNKATAEAAEVVRAARAAEAARAARAAEAARAARAAEAARAARAAEAVRAARAAWAAEAAWAARAAEAARAAWAAEAAWAARAAEAARAARAAWAAGAARAAGAALATGAAWAAGAAGAASLKQSADIVRRHLVIQEDGQ